jgi:small subunit ribosomal protein S17
MHHPGQSFIGTVIKTAMQKTVTVQVERTKIHPLVLKPMKFHKKFLVHDPQSQMVVGDIVRIDSCKKISKRKNFTLGEILVPAQRFEFNGKLHTQKIQ